MVPEAHSDEGRNDHFWEDLVLQIEEQRVIPIVGPDLLIVETREGVQPLYRWAASQLAIELGIATQDLPKDYSLNEVVCAHLGQHGDLGEIYMTLTRIMRHEKLPIPEALRQLAEITDFNLFVTTTFDSLLVDALIAARPGTEPEVLAYSPGKVPDLSSSKETLERPTVYHLFGKITASGGYAVSDEDFLEFVCKLQAPNYSPERLFDELERNNLLILGCGFADWLERFFLRTAKRRKLSDPRDVREVLADRQAQTDQNLVVFLEHFSRKTQIFRNGTPEEFVAELWRRWSDRHPKAEDAPAPVGGYLAPLEPEMPADAIFISYNHEDLDAVWQLYAGLKAAGLPAWFDKTKMKPGDYFDRVIQRNINKCKLFIPVISKNTENRGEGWFRKEWKVAVERQDMKAEDEAFILPVVIDEVKAPGNRVPALFAKLHWSRLPGGAVTPNFAADLETLWRQG